MPLLCHMLACTFFKKRPSSLPQFSNSSTAITWTTHNTTTLRNIQTGYKSWRYGYPIQVFIITDQDVRGIDGYTQAIRIQKTEHKNRLRLMAVHLGNVNFSSPHKQFFFPLLSPSTHAISSISDDHYVNRALRQRMERQMLSF